jgi:uncharacterized protein (TIGR02145 family)
MKKSLTISKIIFFLLLVYSSFFPALGQMRQIYIEPTWENPLLKLSFFSPSQGFVVFEDWLGYTSDSGRTFVKKPISAYNVNSNGYDIPFLGFIANGVKALDQNNLFVYGKDVTIPTILFSNNGGTTFSVVFHSLYDPQSTIDGINDIIFPQNSTVGYAVDPHRILKTVNGGLNWTVSYTQLNSGFDHLIGIDNTNVFAYRVGGNKLLKTVNGSTWQDVILPTISDGRINSVSLLNSGTAYLSISSHNVGRNYLYKTINGGINWTQVNPSRIITPGYFQMKFVNESTGFCLVPSGNSVFKTTDGGGIWEPLPRSINYSYEEYNPVDLQVFSDMQLWVGGVHGFLELNSNADGPTLPKAYFEIDTTMVPSTVSLRNYSKATYQFQWFLNGSLISTAYNASYTHNISRTSDTVKLVVNNGSKTDTLTRVQYFWVPTPPLPTINSFSPTQGGTGTVVTINGTNFTGATSVSFGGTPASSFTVKSPTQISATVGTGSSGSVSVTTVYGTANKTGFTSMVPMLTSFAPFFGGYNDTIKIRGTNLSGVGWVSIGGLDAKSFSKLGDTLIIAVIGFGGSGKVTVINSLYGSVSLPGFTLIAPPALTSFTPTSAKAGDTISISGTGFANVSNIKFGGVPAAAFTVISPNLIKAVVGQAKSGFVTVYASRGSPTLPGFEYQSPLISSVSPNTGAAGTIIEISGKNFTNITGIAVSGVPVVSYTVNSSNSITAELGTGITNANGDISITSTNGVFSKPGIFQIRTAPIIHSFSPVSGQPGSTVTITGANFNPTAADNIVYFGAVRANVKTVSKSQLTVVVPTSATYEPLTVINNNLVCRSKLSFLITSATPKSVTINGLAAAKEFNTKSALSDISTADFDGDGKPDIISRNHDTVTVFRNSSTKGSVALTSKIELYAPSMLPAVDPKCSLAIADIDGDGKLDFITIGQPGLFIFRNTSSIGSIGFASPVIMPANYGYGNSTRAAVADLDGDGKIDIVINAWQLGYFKNLSTPGNISFATEVNIFQQWKTIDIKIADINNDDRPDLVLPNSYTGNYGGFTYYLNTSSINKISFSPAVRFGISGDYPALAIDDFNKDGLPDMFAANPYELIPPNTLLGVDRLQWYSNIFNVVKDTNRILTLAGSFKIDGSRMTELAVGSINGDDKLDILVNRIFDTTMYCVQNIGTSVVPAFSATKVKVKANLFVIVDVDGDGKSDIVSAYNKFSSISVQRNQAGEPVRLCPGGNTILVSDKKGAPYQWQKNTDGIHFNDISNNSIYSGVTKDTLRLTNIPDSLANARYRCVVNGNYSEVFKTEFENRWTGAINSSWENPLNWSCNVVPGKSSNIVIESGHVVLNSNDSIASISVKNGATLIINGGYKLTLLGTAPGADFSDNFLVNTATPTNISNTTAISGGSVSTEFAATGISARGVVWSESPNPTILLATKTIDGGASGSFSSIITGLKPNTIYYLKAYATTNNGTGYGDEITFTTGGLPVISTRKISDLTYSSAISGGSVATDGGSAITSVGIVWGTNPNPTIALSTKTSVALGASTFSSQMMLAPAKTYFVRAYATNAVGAAYGAELSFNTPDSLNIQAVSIGNQVWMLKNLDVTRYRNGDVIPQVTDITEWNSLTTGAWRWYNNDSVTYASTYGRLYNWYAVADPRGLAPEGWHVPTRVEFVNLQSAVTSHGGYLKEVGTAHWQSPNLLASNITGFTARPAGSTLGNIGTHAYFRIADPIPYLSAFVLGYNSDYFGSTSVGNNDGCSIRCIQD